MRAHSRPLRAAVLCGLLTVVAALLVPAAAGAQPAAGPPPGLFGGVSCPTTTFCVAVGSNGTSTLIDTRTATGWHRTKPATHSFVGLGGVSCPTAKYCVAAGWTTNAAGTGVATSLVYRGSTWAQHSVPAPTGAYLPTLYGVSCPSTTRCVAVGQYYVSVSSGTLLPFAEIWNGSTWKLSTMPAPFTPTTSSTVQAQAVSCPSTTSCTAVGEAHASTSDPDVPLIEVLAGGRWTVTPGVAGPGVLTSVSCLAATTCLAAGHVAGNTAIAEVSTGTAWTATTPTGVTPATTDPAGVSCTAGACVVVGSQTGSDGHVATFVGTRVGSTWTTASPAGISTYPHFAAASCVSAAFCVAVGYDAGQAGFARLSESYDGSAWTVETS